jgi:NADPH:quinone reductase-like Zn-dependent oxidoreductase
MSLPKTYRALQLSRPGAVGNFAMAHLPLAAPRPHEVTVRVAACAVAFRDVLDRQGAFKFIRRPTVLGHEFAGTVVAAGRAVARLKEGDAVCSLHWDQTQAWPSPLTRGGAVDSMFGLTCDGGYADYAVSGEGAFAKILPPAAPAAALTPVELSCVTSTFGTVWQGAVTSAGMRAGHRVLVTGASGGVGSAAVLLAKAMGCTVCGVTSSATKAAFLERLGCDEVVVASAEGKFKAAGGPFDIVIEAVGGPTFTSALRAVAPGGALVLLGNVENSTVALPLGLCILNSIRVVGSDSIRRDDLERALLPFMAEHGLRPVVDRTVALGGAGDAHTLLEQRAISGRIVLDMAL